MNFDLESFDAFCAHAIERLKGRPYDSIEAWADGETIPGFAAGAVPAVEMAEGQGAA